MSSSPLRILLVEDNPGDARLVLELIRAATDGSGDLTVANSLATARDAIAADGIDLILLDLGLPDSVGLDTLVSVLQAAPEKPVVVLTGFNDPSTGLAALQMGAQDYLVKGHLTSELLIKTLRYAVERKERERERARDTANEHMFAELGRVLTESLDARERARCVADLTIPRLADWATVEVHTEEGDIVEIQGPDEDAERGLRALFESCTCPGPTASALEAGTRSPDDEHAELLIGEQLLQRAGEDACSTELRTLSIGSALIVPMRARDHRIGGLTLFRSGSRDPFSEADRLTAEEIATRAALGIDNALLFASTRKAQTAAERITHDVMRREALIAALAAASTPQEVGYVIVRHGLEALAAEAALLALSDPSTGTIRLFRAAGLQENVRERWQEITDGMPNPFRDAILGREPVLVKPDEWDARYPEFAKSGAFPGSLAVGPLVCGERTIGLVAFGAPGLLDFDFGPEGSAYLHGCCAKCALAFERAQLFEQEAAARAEAERAIRSRDEVLSIVAHDLRNPVGSVAMYASLMLDMEIPVEKRDKYLRAIGASTRQIDGLIQDLLDVTRVEAGKLTVDVDRIDVVPLIEQSVQALEGIALDKGVTLEVDVANDLEWIVADARRVLQLLSNLLGNAVKFTPRGGKVELRVEPLGDELLFLVIDTGPGIDQENLPHLFDRFWQARKAQRSGAGLGLAIAKGIVDAHGGRIGVESTPGQGSTFFFTLPTDAAKSDERRDTALPEAAAVDDPPLRVVIADDHPIMLRGIAEHLRASPGIEVVAEATSGEAAIEKVRALSPDVVVMDLVMPGIGGIEAIRRIHEIWPSTKLLALTGESEGEALLDVLEAGGSGFVRKVTAHDDLVRAIRTVARDEVFLYPSGQRFLLSAYHAHPERNAKLLASLSEQDRQILALAAEGYTSTEIGKRLYLSPKTVDTYRAQAMRKMGLAHRPELVQFALRTGLLHPPATSPSRMRAPEATPRAV